MIYQDSTDNLARVKRFNATSIIHDKEYNLAPKCTSPKVLYLTANPNGETEVVTIHFHPLCKAKNKTIDYNFVDIDVKKKESQGNILCKYPIMRITHKIDNPMTQTGTSVWYDPTTGRLNSEQRGEYLGSFLDDDSILVLYDTGYYQITTWNFSNHYDMEHIKIITKYNSETVITAIYLETAKNKYYLKRFQIDTTKLDEKFDFLPEENAKLIHITIEDDPYIKLTTQRKRPERNQVDLLQLSSLIAVKGRKAQGNMLSNFPIIKIEPCQAPDHSNTEETNTTNNNNDSKTHDKKSNKTKTSQYMEDLFFID
jgi:topoisomerase-4 subunit A